MSIVQIIEQHQNDALRSFILASFETRRDLDLKKKLGPDFRELLSSATQLRRTALELQRSTKEARVRDAFSQLDLDPDGNKREQILGLLDTLVDHEESVRWLDAPQEQFDGCSPMDLIERGDADRILFMIVRLAEGIPL
jgi:hypothetical protein